MIYLKNALLVLSIILIIVGISLLTMPKYTCVNGKMYEAREDMLVSTGKECLPIDRN